MRMNTVILDNNDITLFLLIVVIKWIFWLLLPIFGILRMITFLITILA